MADEAQNAVDGIVEALDTITDLRPFDHVPDNFEPPAALVAVASVPDYHGAGQGGLPTYEVRATIVVANLDNGSAFTTMNSYLAYAGSLSVRAAIESDTTLGGRVSTCVVDRVENIGAIELGPVRYLAGDWIVTVYA